MSREWKPGDVAIVLQSGCERIAFRNDTDWIDSLGAAWDDDEVTKYGRPIVAIDPADALEVRRLADAFCHARWDHTGGGDECDPLTFSSMQAALREYANPTPPKPEVYEHVPVDTRHGITQALCGKTWESGADVTVVGKCPECSGLAARWVA